MTRHSLYVLLILALACAGCSGDSSPDAVTSSNVTGNISDSTEAPSLSPYFAAIAAEDLAQLDALYTEGHVLRGRNTEGQTLLHHAISERSAPVVKWFLEHGVNPKGEVGTEAPPLSHAADFAKMIPKEAIASADEFAIIRLLIEHGADPMAPRNGHPSPVQHAMDIVCESCVSVMKQASLARAAHSTFPGKSNASTSKE